MNNITPKYDSNNFMCSKCKNVTIHNSLNLYLFGHHKYNSDFFGLPNFDLGYYLEIDFNLSDSNNLLNLQGSMNDNIWKKIFVNDPLLIENDAIKIYIKICSKCGNRIYFDWDSHIKSIDLVNQDMINCDIDGPNEFLDEELVKIYNEARNIYKMSPRSAAALMRYILEQMLVKNFPEVKNCKNLSEMLNNNKVINKIGSNLVNVSNNIRIIANKSIHTNEIDMDQVDINMPEIFKWINDIANVIYNDYSIESKKSNEIKDKITK